MRRKDGWSPLVDGWLQTKPLCPLQRSVNGVGVRDPFLSVWKIVLCCRGTIIGGVVPRLKQNNVKKICQGQGFGSVSSRIRYICLNPDGSGFQISLDPDPRHKKRV